jgi:hypothetical protein
MADDGKMTQIRCKEIETYIKHLKALDEYDPMVFHHAVIYRPLIKIYEVTRK